ncbi:MFS transporter [Streptomyces sp. NPDC001939]|uniref:MFS transporter n=1 Tax=Streptomyces TaxID=1883 RepID=UPI001D0B86F0|nr:MULTISPECIES: MFS transporter [Streptomyces]MCX5087309.1 MFS transporter [Streptomyces sp. NBC_00401]UDL97587.1 MFS transporter [Streptomyces longhuiensis]
MTAISRQHTPQGNSTEAPPPPRRVSTKRAVAAATIGNALEFFDLAVYALMAVYIGRTFFPADNPGVQLVEAYAVFGVTYLIRPLSGLLIGSYADRHGRKKALMLTIWLMVLGTFMIAFMPGYSTLGFVAPVGVVIARLIQGFGAGGEFGAATSFLVEQNERRKSFLGSFQFASQGLATLMASGFATGLTATLSEEQMTSWGWRVPFVFGLLVGPAGYLIRRYAEEAPATTRAAASGNREEKPSPIRSVFRDHWGGLLIASGAMVVSTALNFLLQYLPTFAIKDLGVDDSLSFAALLITGVILTLGTPVVGLLADRFGRLKIMIPAAASIGVCAVPLFLWLTTSPSFLTLALCMTVLGMLKATYFGALPSVMSDVFPAEARATGLAFSYNTTVAVFGGFAPTIAAALVTATGSQISPSYYLMAVAALSIAALAGGYRIRGIR